MHARPRVLFARPDHLGDALLTLPGVAGLRRALPEAHIAYVASERAAEVPRHCPHVDETIVVPFPDVAEGLDPSAIGSLVAEHAPRLAGFEAGIVTRADDPWTAQLLAAADVRFRVGYALPRTRPWLTHALPDPGNASVIDIGLELASVTAQRFGRALPPGGSCPELFVTTPTEQAEAERALATVGSRPVLIHPGSGWPLKNWPARRWAALARRLRRELGHAPVVVAAPGDQELVEHVVGASRGSAQPLGRVLSLGALAALQRVSRLVVGTDSGALHLAAMVGAPVVAIFGPADPVTFALPGSPRRCRVVHAELACRPCGTLVDPPCGATVAPACVTSVDVEQVLSVCLDLVGARSRRSRRAADVQGVERVAR